MPANREKVKERKWRKVPADLTCSMSQLYPTFWLRQKNSPICIKSWLYCQDERVPGGSSRGPKDTCAYTFNACTYACERVRKTVKRRCYRDMLVFVCLLAHYCLLGQSGLIKFWKQITSANHSIKPTRGLGHYLEYSTTSFALLRMKRNCGQQGNSMKL